MKTKDKALDFLKQMRIPVLGILMALAFGAVLMLFVDIDPWQAYSVMLRGSLGGRVQISETLVRATPILLTGLAYAFAYRCGLFNIGAEGQLYIGALAATIVAVLIPPMPIFIHLPLALLAGFVGGGLWCAIPGILKAWRGISETITTIMFVYIGQYLVSYFVAGPISDTSHFPQSPPIPVYSRLPNILPGTRLNLGFLVALAAVLVYYIVLYRSSKGLQIRVVGANIRAAQYIGINAKRTIVLSMLISGGLAGLGGAVEVIGVQGRLLEGFSPGFGWDGITVGLLGRTHPVGILLAALFLGMLRSGGMVMQRTMGVPIALIYAIQAIIIIVGVAGTYADFKKRKLAGDPVGPDAEVPEGGTN